MIVPQDALERLRAGNQRYVDGTSVATRDDTVRRAALVEGQQPFAAILGCADSRVPPALVFDEGPGELFVVRVAGNVAGTSQLASLEFAVAVLGVRLIVVLGHAGCGAVAATLAALDGESAPPSPSLQALVDRIAPAVADIEAPSAEARLAQAMRANVEATVTSLRTSDPVLAPRAAAGELEIVGADYALDTGVVTFYES